MWKPFKPQLFYLFAVPPNLRGTLLASHLHDGRGPSNGQILGGGRSLQFDPTYSGAITHDQALQRLDRRHFHHVVVSF